MRNRLNDESSSGLISPLIDVIFNALAAMLIILFIYMILFSKSEEPLRFLPVEPPDAAWDVPYAYSLPVIGGNSARVFTIVSGELPDSLLFDTSLGLIIGVPSSKTNDGSVQTVQLRVSVDDSTYHAETTLVFRVVPSAVPFDESRTPLAILHQDSVLPQGRVSTWYTSVIGSVGGLEPQRWRVISGALPPGLSLDSGRIFGVPTGSGDYRFVVQSAYSAGRFQFRGRSFDWSAGSVEREFSLRILDRVNHRLVFPAGRIGERYNGSVICENLLPGDRVEIDGSAPGLRIGPQSVVTGTPTDTGTFPFSFIVAHNKDTLVRGSFDICILPKMPSPAVGNTTMQCWVGEPINYAIPHTGLTEPVRVISGSDLPAGLSLDGGSLVGIPTKPSLSSVPIEAVDALGARVDGRIGIRIGPKRTELQAHLPDTIRFLAGRPFEWFPSASGGEGEISWQLQAPSTSGLILKDGRLSGAIEQPGITEVTLQVHDAFTSSRDDATTVLQGIRPDTSRLRILTRQLPTAHVGLPYEIVLASEGGIGVPQWYISPTSDLPPGLALTQSGIRGTPTRAGTATISVAVSDEEGSSDGTYSLTLEVVDLTEAYSDSLVSARDSIGKMRSDLSELIDSVGAMRSSATRLRDSLAALQSTWIDHDDSNQDQSDIQLPGAREATYSGTAPGIWIALVALLAALVVLLAVWLVILRRRLST